MNGQLERDIAAMVQLWKEAGQTEHAKALRAQMWELLGRFYK